MKFACVVCAFPTTNRNKRCDAHQIRARPRGNAFEPTRQRILTRDGHRCQIRLPGCTTHAEHVDHIVLLADGGDDSDDNLRAACAWCNLRRGTSLDTQGGLGLGSE
jgi:5-methylcytosine-specific restriction endonuclease McrA